MTWSPQQAAALGKVGAWLCDPARQIFRLFGYAGTGKTTLATHVAEDHDGPVRFAAFTGKAASIMRAKGCDGASTVHSLLYRTRVDRKLAVEGGRSVVESEKLHFDDKGRGALSRDTLVILDECSMIAEKMANDLLRHGCKVLVLGDPFQLPPIDGTGYFEREPPDVVLTEVHRQAAESPILRLATDVREGRGLVVGNYGDAEVVRVKRWSEVDHTRFDQLIVGRNVTRTNFNRHVRQKVNYLDPLPMVGDRLICTRNAHSLGLMNGELGSVESVERLDADTMNIVLRRDGDEEGDSLDFDAWTAPFLGQKIPYQAEPPWPVQLDFGYAVTAHKAQGSGWDAVLLCDESATFREMSARWLYVGITRAAKRLTVAVA